MIRKCLPIAMLFAAFILLSGLAVAQERGGGTINSLTINPTVNQELTGTMATVTGVPDDVTPGSQNMESGLTPVTTNMVGSGSNGNMNQPLVEEDATNPKTKTPTGAVHPDQASGAVGKTQHRPAESKR